MIFDINPIKDIEAERLLFNIGSMYPHSFGGIICVVDTGSPRTIISARDVSRLNIPVSNLEMANPICGFGRGSVPCRKLKKFKFYIKSKDGKIKHIEMPVYAVDVPALNSLSGEAKMSAYKIDSIIGLDFLISQNMRLVVDFNMNSFYFEDRTL